MFGLSNLPTTLIPTCQFVNFVCVIALFSCMVYQSNDPVPNDKNNFTTTFELFIISLNCFTSFEVIISISC